MGRTISVEGGGENRKAYWEGQEQVGKNQEWGEAQVEKDGGWLRSPREGKRATKPVSRTVKPIATSSPKGGYRGRREEGGAEDRGGLPVTRKREGKHD